MSGGIARPTLYCEGWEKSSDPTRLRHPDPTS